MKTRFVEKIETLLARHYISLNEESITLLEKHWLLLKEMNEKFNLTSIIDEDNALIKHYLDSLLLLPHLEKRKKLLDIGSGAGFPGIPLAIAEQQREIVLMEASEKKARFLEVVKNELNLTNLKIINNRAEKAAHEEACRATFYYVTARAVSSLSVLIEYAIPFLKKGGIFLAMKGPNGKEEIDKANNALKLLNAKVVDIIEYNLSETGDCRTIIKIMKEEDTPEKYPRREGKPEKSPL